jgi:AbrB family looped-hinge helix DNA binding protein
MNNHTYMKQRTRCKEESVGSTVVGERGQVVIPKDIRDQMGLKPGTKLIVFHHKGGPVALMPMNMMRSFLKEMTGKMNKI